MVARSVSLMLAGIGGLLLASCVPERIRQAENRPALGPAALAGPTEPVRFTRLVSTIQRGTRIGSTYYALGACRISGDVSWRGDAGEQLNSPEIPARFAEALSNAGYRVVGDSQQLFDVEAERVTARYLVGAQLLEVQMSVCDQLDFWRAEPLGRTYGTAYIAVNWQVYSLAERRVLFETRTEGSAKTETGTRDGITVLLLKAFSHAATNLAFDQKFRDAIAVRDGGARLASVPATTATPIEIPRYAPYREAIRARTAEISRAGVTILTGSAHGSGFFVSDDGLILTNQHVVGHAEQVNVRLAAGVEVVGRVLRRDAVRDVALVKVDIARTRPLPIGMEVPAVGSDVYTLGTPSDPGLAGTLTRGIVSAFRTFDRGGVELPMIQSDAAIHGGNSGGPLMDASGNVVGIAVAGAARDGQTRAGLNFFIPIEDALRYLNIRLGQPRELRF